MPIPVQTSAHIFSGGLKTSSNETASDQHSVRSISNGWINILDGQTLEPLPDDRTRTYAQAVADGVELQRIFQVDYPVERRFVGYGTKVGTFEDIDGSYLPDAEHIGLTSVTNLDMAAMNGSVYFVNGVDAPFKATIANPPVFADVSTTRPAITAASTSLVAGAAPSVTVTGLVTADNGGANNNVEGVVRYWIATVTSSVEGRLSDAFGRIDCDTGTSVDVTFPDDSAYNGKTFNLYRTKKNGTKPYFLAKVTATGAGSSYTYEDNTADANLGDGPQQGSHKVEGVVKYWISQMSGSPATTESAISAVFGEIDAGDGNRVLVDLDNAAFGTNTYRLYRSYAAGPAPFYVAEVKGGEVYEDNTADAYLGYPPFVHGDAPPSDAIAIVAHFNRLFTLGADSELHWSDLGYPSSFWTENIGNHLTVFGDDGDEGAALARTQDGILIFKKNHLYLLRGRVPADFYLTEVTMSDTNQSVGTINSRSVASIQGGVAFYWNRGIYIYSGGSLVSVHEEISDVLDQMSAINDKPVLGYYPYRNQLWVSISSTLGTYIYDVKKRQWVGHATEAFNDFVFSSTGTTIQIGPGVVQPFHMGGLLVGTDGAFWQVDNGSTTNTIDARLPIDPLGDNSDTKRILFVDVFVEEWTGDTATLTVTPVVDGVDQSAIGINPSQTSNVERHRVHIVRVGHSVSLRIQGTNFSIKKIIYGYQNLGSRVEGVASS